MSDQSSVGLEQVQPAVVELTPDERFIRYLCELAKRQDRGKLAALRRGLGKPPGSVWEMYPILGPFLADRPGVDDARFMVASLFALHPQHSPGQSLGRVCRQCGEHESAEKRFQAMLESHADELPYRLRQIISLARSRPAPVGVDYVQLLKDLRNWDHPERWVQERWARDYWRQTGDRGISKPADTEAAGTTEDR